MMEQGDGLPVAPRLELLGGPPRGREALRSAVSQIVGLPSAQQPLTSALTESEPGVSPSDALRGGVEETTVVDGSASTVDAYAEELTGLVMRARTEWATIFPGHGVSTPPASGRAQQWFWREEAALGAAALPQGGERGWVPYSPFDCCRIEHHPAERDQEEGRGRVLRSEESPLLTAADGVAWLAVRKGDTRQLERALQAGADPDLRAPLHLRESLLHAACRHGHLSCARLLLHGIAGICKPADSLLRDADGQDALDAAKDGARVGGSWWQPAAASSKQSAIDHDHGMQAWGGRAQQGILLKELHRLKRFAEAENYDRKAARKRCAPGIILCDDIPP
eukprot:COSAG01_NODE_452_length_16879_cov_474.367223_2_plen_337_part_00